MFFNLTIVSFKDADWWTKCSEIYLKNKVSIYFDISKHGVILFLGALALISICIMVVLASHFCFQNLFQLLEVCLRHQQKGSSSVNNGFRGWRLELFASKHYFPHVNCPVSAIYNWVPLKFCSFFGIRIKIITPKSDFVLLIFFAYQERKNGLRNNTLLM